MTVPDRNQPRNVEWTPLIEGNHCPCVQPVAPGSSTVQPTPGCIICRGRGIIGADQAGMVVQIRDGRPIWSTERLSAGQPVVDSCGRQIGATKPVHAGGKLRVLTPPAPASEPRPGLPSGTRCGCLARLGCPHCRGTGWVEPQASAKKPEPRFPTINPVPDPATRLRSLEAVRELAERLWQSNHPAGRVVVDRVTRCQRWPSDEPRTLLLVELGDVRAERLLDDEPPPEELEGTIEQLWIEVSDKIARRWRP